MVGRAQDMKAGNRLHEFLKAGQEVVSEGLVLVVATRRCGQRCQDMGELPKYPARVQYNSLWFCFNQG